ncbi:MAG: hypothetical protein J5724_05800 [Ruminococcus sp.]|uniref:hypothetical protein n=1 Tax=Ruminococcus sp. TaxID=41978 RepID=UPI001B413DC0|nr:hypothetical protein [Ruminococcus sp.]MBO4493885.1 hypothetical protein [Ruminococcus sp.]MBP5433806.1 hypothetical protein [Ruminococcus sp.]
MEFKKDFHGIHIEGGSVKAAGKGNLAVSEEVPQDIHTKIVPKTVAKTAVKAAALTGLVILRHKVKKRKS